MSRYQPLLEPITLPNGAMLANRLAMAPMDVRGSSTDGTVTEEHIEYFRRRNRVGGLIITGAVSVSFLGTMSPRQKRIHGDEYVPELAKLADAMKAGGSKALLQIFHAGRNAAPNLDVIGRFVSASAVPSTSSEHVPEALTDDEIHEIVDDFGEATRRAIQAGFDGVEIHGANHHLIQQFFSTYTNRRDDIWGGDLPRRMNFAIAVTTRVVQVARTLGHPEFIVGYRVCPEEVHGDSVGYSIDEGVQLIDRIVDLGVDYIHTSTFGGRDFSQVAYRKPPQRGDTSAAMNTLVRHGIAGRVPLVVSGSIYSAEAALDAMNYGDIAALATAAIADPDFFYKIASGAADQINLDVTDRLADIAVTGDLMSMYQRAVPMFPPIKGLSPAPGPAD